MPSPRSLTLPTTWARNKAPSCSFFTLRVARLPAGFLHKNTATMRQLIVAAFCFCYWIYQKLSESLS